MANLIEQVGSSFGNFSWTGLGQVTFILTIFLIIVVFMLMLAFLMWWKSYYIKVKIYAPFGQVTLSANEIAEAKNNPSSLNNKVKFDMIKYKRTHGKYVTIKGTNYFHVFMPFKKIEPISADMMFHDGVHLLKLSNDVLLPIQKPKTVISLSENVTISITENNQWQAWNNMMADRINNKYQDIDAQKKIMTFFIIGIVAIVLVGAFLLWLIYSSVNKGFNAADKLSQAVDGLVGKGKPV